MVREVLKNNMMKENFYIIIINKHSSIANDAYEIMLYVIEKKRRLQSDFNVRSHDD
jgi:hypothetical protein